MNGSIKAIYIKTLIPDNNTIYPVFSDTPGTFLCSSFNSTSKLFCQFSSRRVAAAYCRTNSAKCAGIVCTIDKEHKTLCTCTALPVQSEFLPGAISQRSWILGFQSMPLSVFEGGSTSAEPITGTATSEFLDNNRDSRFVDFELFGPYFNSSDAAMVYCKKCANCTQVVCSQSVNFECRSSKNPIALLDFGDESTTMYEYSGITATTISFAASASTFQNAGRRLNGTFTTNNGSHKIGSQQPNYAVLGGIPVVVIVTVFSVAGYMYAKRRSVASTNAQSIVPPDSEPNNLPTDINTNTTAPFLLALPSNPSEVEISVLDALEEKRTRLSLYQGIKGSSSKKQQSSALNQMLSRNLSRTANVDHTHENSAIHHPLFDNKNRNKPDQFIPENTPTQLEINPNVHMWSAQDVYTWLLEIGASIDSAQVAVEEEIDGSALLLIRTGDLNRIFGERIKTGERLRITQGLSELSRVVGALPPSYEESPNSGNMRH